MSNPHCAMDSRNHSNSVKRNGCLYLSVNRTTCIYLTDHLQVDQECKSMYTVTWKIAFRFLGMFAKLQKVTVSFIMSMCLSVRGSTCVENWATTGQIFMKFDI